MKKVKRVVKHVEDGTTEVLATGYISNGIFYGEYWYEGVTWGCTIDENTKIERTNILHEFFQSKSDSNEFLEASNQEKLELEFQLYMTKDMGELHALDFVNEVCTQSLSPESFESWEKIKLELRDNRLVLKRFNYLP